MYMKNYKCVAKTNFFRVTDEEKYQELILRLSSIHDFMNTMVAIEDLSKEKDGVLYHCFGTYTPLKFLDEEDCELGFGVFVSELQQILPKDEVFSYMVLGHEEFNHVDGHVLIAMDEKVVTKTLSQIAKETARKMLYN